MLRTFYFFELIRYIKQLANSFQIHFLSSIDKKTITNNLLLFKKNYKSAVIQKRNLENVSFISPLSHSTTILYTAQKMKFSIKDFFSKCDQILNGKIHFLNLLLEAIQKQKYNHTLTTLTYMLIINLDYTSVILFSFLRY